MTTAAAMSEEPDINNALRWFGRQPGAFTFVGWKEHLFEFLVTHCGDLIIHENGTAKKGLNRYCFNSAQFFFLWGLGDTPPRIMEAQHIVDDGSCRQELLEGRLPVVITRTRLRGSPSLGNLVVKQTVFAHRTGGKELERGDEPIFAWAR